MMNFFKSGNKQYITINSTNARREVRGVEFEARRSRNVVLDGPPAHITIKADIITLEVNSQGHSIHIEGVENTVIVNAANVTVINVGIRFMLRGSNQVRFYDNNYGGTRNVNTATEVVNNPADAPVDILEQVERDEPQIENLEQVEGIRYASVLR